MSTCNIDKWNMLAPTFDAFEIPKIGEDDCLTLINDLKLLTKDSSVMDVGCGAGRYAIAFAQMCRSVIGTDLSPQMIDYAQKSFHFSKDSLTAGCEDDSEIICAINLTVKCSIDPKFAECDKSKMPKFIFMEDESLQRPTESGYKITKLKPIAEGQMEVYTQSQCNGQWFGLCNGNIIYVMGQKDGHWVVKDLYAMQTTN
mgnify:CR=1 FL=1